jgi:hypothetical protein
MTPIEYVRRMAVIVNEFNSKVVDLFEKEQLPYLTVNNDPEGDYANGWDREIHEDHLFLGGLHLELNNKVLAHIEEHTKDPRCRCMVEATLEY